MRKKVLKQRVKEVYEFFFNLIVAITMLSIGAFFVAVTIKLVGWI